MHIKQTIRIITNPLDHIHLKSLTMLKVNSKDHNRNIIP